MSDHDHDRPTLVDATEEDVRHLLEQAGPRPPLPEEDLEEMRRAAREAWDAETGSRPAASRTPARWILALAATVLLALGIGWWVARDAIPPAPAATAARVERAFGAPRATGPDGEPLALAAGLSLPVGTTLETSEPSDAAGLAVRLASGVSVRLGGGSRLTLSSESAVRLDRGAVYVDTGGASSDQPHIEVRTPLGTATDVGTQFLVELRGAGDELSIGVREGEVRLRQNAHEHRATAGTLLVVDRQGEVVREDLSSTDAMWRLAWATAPPFAGDTLAELLDWTARETGWAVRYAEPGVEQIVARTTVHGSVGPLPPDQAALAVLPGAGLEGTLEDGVLVVGRP